MNKYFFVMSLGMMFACNAQGAGESETSERNAQAVKLIQRVFQLQAQELDAKARNREESAHTIPIATTIGGCIGGVFYGRAMASMEAAICELQEVPLTKSRPAIIGSSIVRSGAIGLFLGGLVALHNLKKADAYRQKAKYLRRTIDQYPT